MFNDSAELLVRTGQEPGHVFKSNERNIEGIAKSNKARTLHRPCDIKAAGKIRGLIRDNAHRTAVESRKADDEIPSVVFLDLEKVVLVYNRMDDVFDVVRNIGFRRHH